ncbi:hypothetical protein PR048_033289 [Dryococelus australis]|uniref:Uncharacterized protein n=1 Tax=Dryococelus australis TaxID=614101 RepID=A0ABQ9G2Z8_9NEOP|nr:hypothetical protein PR048_033289 [Dryococelus australis]
MGSKEPTHFLTRGRHTRGNAGGLLKTELSASTSVTYAPSFQNYTEKRDDLWEQQHDAKLTPSSFNARLHHRGSKLDPRSDLRSTQKTVAPFKFRAGLLIEMKFISKSRNWRFEISIRDQQPSSTNLIDESEIQNHEISLVQHIYTGTKIKLDPGSELGSFDLGLRKTLVPPGFRPVTAMTCRAYDGPKLQSRSPCSGRSFQDFRHRRTRFALIESEDFAESLTLTPSRRFRTPNRVIEVERFAEAGCYCPERRVLAVDPGHTSTRRRKWCRRLQYQLDYPLVDDRPIMNAVKYRVVYGVVWTNRTMVSSNTHTNRTGVLAVVDIDGWLRVQLNSLCDRGGAVVNFRTRIVEDLGSNPGLAIVISVFPGFPKLLQVKDGMVGSLYYRLRFIPSPSLLSSAICSVDSTVDEELSLSYLPSLTTETLHDLRVGAMRRQACVLVSPVSLPRFLTLDAQLHNTLNTKKSYSLGHMAALRIESDVNMYHSIPTSPAIPPALSVANRSRIWLHVALFSDTSFANKTRMDVQSLFGKCLKQRSSNDIANDRNFFCIATQRGLGSPLVDDRPIMNAVKYRLVSGVVWTNRTMVSSNTRHQQNRCSCSRGSYRNAERRWGLLYAFDFIASETIYHGCGNTGTLFPRILNCSSSTVAANKGDRALNQRRSSPHCLALNDVNRQATRLLQNVPREITLLVSSKRLLLVRTRADVIRDSEFLWCSFDTPCRILSEYTLTLMNLYLSGSEQRGENGAAPECKGKKREIPEKTHRPAASYGTAQTCKNPGKQDDGRRQDGSLKQDCGLKQNGGRKQDGGPAESLRDAKTEGKYHTLSLSACGRSWRSITITAGSQGIKKCSLYRERPIPTLLGTRQSVPVKTYAVKLGLSTIRPTCQTSVRQSVITSIPGRPRSAPAGSPLIPQGSRKSRPSCPVGRTCRPRNRATSTYQSLAKTTPLDHVLWGHMKGSIYQTSVESEEKLPARVMAAADLGRPGIGDRVYQNMWTQKITYNVLQTWERSTCDVVVFCFICGETALASLNEQVQSTLAAGQDGGVLAHDQHPAVHASMALMRRLLVDAQVRTKSLRERLTSMQHAFCCRRENCVVMKTPATGYSLLRLEDERTV